MEWLWLAMIFLGVAGSTYSFLVLRRHHGEPR
jgi:hypothetical protein